jgi:hypothetical protein
MSVKTSKKRPATNATAAARKSAANSQTGKQRDKKTSALPDARCLEVAERGVRDIADFSEMMSAMMSDVVMGSISPQVANAAINAGGKLLKAAEMQLKYGEQKRQTSMALVATKA